MSHHYLMNVFIGFAVFSDKLVQIFGLHNAITAFELSNFFFLKFWKYVLEF